MQRELVDFKKYFETKHQEEEKFEENSADKEP